MFTKSIIAHELGHALSSEFQDGYGDPINIEFEPDGNELAICWCAEHEKKKPNVAGVYSKTKSISDLGGIFGELLYTGGWNPWGARVDVDNFLCSNYRSTSNLKNELDEWMWVDDDSLSMRACTCGDTITSRRSFELDHHDTCERLPAMWLAYVDFCNRIDKTEFRRVVDEILKNKTKTIY